MHGLRSVVRGQDFVRCPELGSVRFARLLMYYSYGIFNQVSVVAGCPLLRGSVMGGSTVLLC